MHEYDTLLAGRAEATFFHTRAWARIVTQAFPALQDCSRIAVRDGERFALPLFRWRRLGGLLRTTHSSFPFLYGGPIPATQRGWEAFWEHVARLGASFTVLGNPFAPADGTQAAAAPAATGPETTHLLRLPPSVEQYWSEVLTSRKRNDIRRLTRKGVAIERSRDPADIAAVYALYRRRMESWDRRPGLVYPLALYRAMVAAGSDAVRLYIARFEGRLIGGTFVVRHNGIVHYNAGYFDDGARRLRPNVLIQERIIRDAIEAGYRCYDFLPSAGLENVAAFKESFGGVATAFPRWEQVGRTQRWVRHLRKRGAGAPSADSASGERA